MTEATLPRHESMNVDDVRSRGLRAHLCASAGAPRLGWKVAFNTAPVQRLLGYTTDELVGEAVFGLIHPDDVVEPPTSPPR